jgi:hypothetical protein
VTGAAGSPPTQGDVTHRLGAGRQVGVMFGVRSVLYNESIMKNDIRLLQMQLAGRFGSGLGALMFLDHLPEGDHHQFVLRTHGHTIELRVRRGRIEHLGLRLRTHLRLYHAPFAGQTVPAKSDLVGAAARAALYDHARGGLLLAPMMVEVTAAAPAPGSAGLMGLRELLLELLRHHDEGLAPRAA